MSDRIFLALVAGQQDEQGRITSTRQLWPIEASDVKGLATITERHIGFGVALLAGFDKLAHGGLADTPEVREALGLPPRRVVTRDENEATGVAGVEG